MAIFAHPDDELGCVGTLCKHTARGDAAMLVWTTHGELASHFGGKPAAEVRRTREHHGAHVAGRLGAEHRFFDMGDSHLTGSRAEALQLARLYARWQPDAIITWDDYSAHPDHRMTAKIAFDAITLARIPKILGEDDELAPHRKPVKLYQYAHSAASWPTVSVDIGEQLEAIKELFGFYRDFYGWEWSAEQFAAHHAIAGREAGVEYAETFQLRKHFAPAWDYLP